MAFLGSLFNWRNASRSSDAYEQAMRVSDDLLSNMRNSPSNEAVRDMLADIWSRNHNIPFLTAVYEAVSEMKVPIAKRQRPPSNDG